MYGIVSFKGNSLLMKASGSTVKLSTIVDKGIKVESPRVSWSTFREGNGWRWAFLVVPGTVVMRELRLRVLLAAPVNAVLRPLVAST